MTSLWGGHVSSGETYEDAFRKETQEELNIDIDAIDYKVLGKCSQKNDGVSVFMTIYEIMQDTVPEYNSQDFQSYEWIRPEDLIRKIQSGVKAKSDLPIVVKKFYL